MKYSELHQQRVMRVSIALTDEENSPSLNAQEQYTAVLFHPFDNAFEHQTVLHAFGLNLNKQLQYHEGKVDQPDLSSVR